MDSNVGRILDQLSACGLSESTRVIYTSDHGESMGRRGSGVDRRREMHIQFAATRGRQAGRTFYTVMVKLRDLPKLVTFADESLSPELRAQRRVNMGRVPKISPCPGSTPSA